VKVFLLGGSSVCPIIVWLIHATVHRALETQVKHGLVSLKMMAKVGINELSSEEMIPMKQLYFRLEMVLY
jgi:hypothetical protein